VAEEVAYQVKKAGYATIVPREEVCRLRPPNLNWLSYPSATEGDA
jgi:hypothetical protein